MFTKLIVNRLMRSTIDSVICRHVLRHNQPLKTLVQSSRCLTSSVTSANKRTVLDKRGVVRPKIAADGQSSTHLQDLDLNDKELIDMIGVRKIKALDNKPDTELLDEISPALPLSFNLAAFANKSQTIQKLIELGVDLAFIEKKFFETAEYLLRLDFETDVKPYIEFLVDKGVEPDQLGYFLTRNPWFFTQNMDDLQVRINYLESKRFNKQMIASIISKAPHFLNKTTKYIDYQLATLQKEFGLTANQLRFLVTKYPRIVLLHEMSVQKLKFIFKEEFGFNETEVKEMILSSPYVFHQMVTREKTHRIGVKVFDLIHNQMKIPHELIAKFPLIFQRRVPYIEWRHLYLKNLGRDQYDPKLPLYVPLSAFYELEDNQFCETYAKTSVRDFNLFLKTL